MTVKERKEMHPLVEELIKDIDLAAQESVHAVMAVGTLSKLMYEYTRDLSNGEELADFVLEGNPCADRASSVLKSLIVLCVMCTPESYLTRDAKVDILRSAPNRDLDELSRDDLAAILSKLLINLPLPQSKQVVATMESIKQDDIVQSTNALETSVFEAHPDWVPSYLKFAPHVEFDSEDQRCNAQWHVVYSSCKQLEMLNEINISSLPGGKLIMYAMSLAYISIYESIVTERQLKLEDVGTTIHYLQSMVMQFFVADEEGNGGGDGQDEMPAQMYDAVGAAFLIAKQTIADEHFEKFKEELFAFLEEASTVPSYCSTTSNLLTILQASPKKMIQIVAAKWYKAVKPIANAYSRFYGCMELFHKTSAIYAQYKIDRCKDRTLKHPKMDGAKVKKLRDVAKAKLEDISLVGLLEALEVRLPAEVKPIGIVGKARVLIANAQNSQEHMEMYVNFLKRFRALNMHAVELYQWNNENLVTGLSQCFVDNASDIASSKPLPELVAGYFGSNLVTAKIDGVLARRLLSQVERALQHPAFLKVIYNANTKGDADDDDDIAIPTISPEAYLDDNMANKLRIMKAALALKNENNILDLSDDDQDDYDDEESSATASSSSSAPPGRLALF